MVYSDSDVDGFIGQGSLIASAHSFDRNGKLFVYFYTWYKNDYACMKMFTPAQKANIPMFGYKLRWLDVDTRKDVARMPMQFLIGTDGRMDTPIKGSQQ